MKTSLNLLPPGRKSLLRRRFRTTVIVRYGAAVLLVPMAAMLALSGLLMAAQIERQGLDMTHSSLTAGADYAALMDTDRAIGDANAAVRRDGQILAAQRAFSGPIVAIAGAAPDHVRVTMLTIDDSALLTITGVARTRDDILAFRDALAAQDCFTGIDLPITSIVRPEDTPFSMVATVTDTCL